MNKVSASDENQVIRDSKYRLEKYLDNAIELIDKKFCSGYAASHPELTIECIRVQSEDFKTAYLSEIIDSASFKISSAIKLIR